jgi:hypothetical protein
MPLLRWSRLAVASTRADSTALAACLAALPCLQRDRARSLDEKHAAASGADCAAQRQLGGSSETRARTAESPRVGGGSLCHRLGWGSGYAAKPHPSS